MQTLRVLIETTLARLAQVTTTRLTHNSPISLLNVGAQIGESIQAERLSGEVDALVEAVDAFDFDEAVIFVERQYSACVDARTCECNR